MAAEKQKSSADTKKVNTKQSGTAMEKKNNTAKVSVKPGPNDKKIPIRLITSSVFLGLLLFSWSFSSILRVGFRQ